MTPTNARLREGRDASAYRRFRHSRRRQRTSHSLLLWPEAVASTRLARVTASAPSDSHGAPQVPTRSLKGGATGLSRHCPAALPGIHAASQTRMTSTEAKSVKSASWVTTATSWRSAVAAIQVSCRRSFRPARSC